VTDLREQLKAALSGAYTIERELGGAGMSRVFVAEDAALGRRVVVKVLPAELSGGVSLARFQREIALAARLQHPHIVSVLSAGDIDGLPYYTMPFVSGESLRAKLEHGELPVREAISVLRDVAKALEFAHANGIAHRDIKPDNVLMAGSSAVVTDFGIAKALRDSAGPETLTAVGVALGTAAYMAPEQAVGDPSTDLRADIYSFGVMAYELLAGHTPFAGRSMQAAMAAHATEAPAPLLTVRPALPATLTDLVMRCLEKRPSDRPQLATEIVQVLDAIGTSHELPATVRSPRQASTAKNRWSMLVTAGVFVVAIAAAIEWRARAARPDVGVHSIAVLPLENKTGDTTFDFLEDGITDHVRDALNALHGLSVKARSSSQQLKGRGAREAKAKLGVDAVLQGTVSRSHARLHVTTELVRTSDDNVLWSQTFDAEPSAIMRTQDTITNAVSGALHLGSVGRRPGAGDRGTTDAEAYSLFLQGRHAFDAFDFPMATARFRNAVRRDPRFARALGYLAMSEATAPVLGVGSLDSALRVAQVSVDRALALDSTVVEAYIAESFILGSDMRLGDGLKPLQRALSFDSTNADLLWSYGGGLGQVGDVDRSLVALQRAREQDPLSVTALGLSSYSLYLARRYREAIAMIREALDLNPHMVIGLRGLGLYFAFSGQPDSAAAAFEATFKVDSAVVGGRSNLVFGYAVAGRWADADRQRALINYADAGNSRNYYRTMVDLAYGDFDGAMAAFEQGVKDRDPLFSNISLPCDPLFDPLKSNPRFAVVMRRIGAHACPAGPWPIAPRRRANQ
jgi:eukaryotic-like serine/threonine-protein kinase